MCTVTFVPVKDGYYITSNRDEKKQRSKAIPPKTYKLNEATLLFPRDTEAGGTWIAIKDKMNAAVLLNGGFIKHIPEPPYKLSRGLILLDVLSDTDPFNYFLRVSITGIEPFTLILFCNGNLYECRWNGEEKFTSLKEVNKTHIWSSVTLYDEPTRKKRQQWFERFINNHNEASQDDILHFHQFAGDGDKQSDIQMNRGGELFTVSITGIYLAGNKAEMTYMDLKEGNMYKEEISSKNLSDVL